MESKPRIESKKTAASRLGVGFPNNSDCLDWIGLLQQHNQSPNPSDWLKALYTGSGINIPLINESFRQDPLDHLYFENRNKSVFKINYPLFIGFPLVLQVKNNQLHSLPLFKIPIELKFIPEKPGRWIIQKSNKSPWEINPRAESLFTTVEWQELTLRLSTTKSPLSLLSEILSEPELSPDNWQAFPQSELWPQKESSFQVYPSAILAHFPDSSNQIVFKDVPNKEDHNIASWKYHFASPFLDPSQRTAIKQVYQNRDSVICGKPGAGKIHTSNFLVENSLLNGKKILVIGGRHPSLKKIQEQLDQQGLAQMCYNLSDLEQDSPLLLGLIRNLLNAEFPQSYPIQKTTQKALETLQNQKSKFDSSYNATRRQVFGQFSWLETVGLHLKSNAQLSKALSGSQIQAMNLQFTTNEFQHLSQKITQAETLFSGLGSIRHPLRQLHPQLFLSLSFQEAKAYAESKLQFFLNQFSDLQQAFIGISNDYGHQLKQYFFNYHQKNQSTLTELLAEIENNEKVYGTAFTLTSSFSLKLYSPFSKRIQEIKKEKERLIAAVRGFHQQIKPISTFDFSKDKGEEIKSLSQAKTFLKDFQEALNDWFTEVPIYVDQSVKRLNHQSIQKGLKLQTPILQLEDRLDQTIQLLNQAELLSESQKNEMLTIPKMLWKIENILDTLETLKLNLRDFEPFFAWQNFWLQLQTQEQEIIKAIIRINPKTWNDPFDAWYFNQLLLKNELSALPKQDPLPKSFFENSTLLKSSLGSLIKQEWIPRQSQALKAFSALLGTSDSMDWSYFFTQYGVDISTMFPVLCCTPGSAFQAFKNVKEPLFDLILFESAQYIDPGLGQFLKTLAKQAVIMGDDSFIENDNKPDLLEWALQKQFPRTDLSYIHQYYPANLWQLTRGKYITQKAIQAFNIQVIQASGSYQPDEKINAQEVKLILDHLLKIPRTPQRTYPRIALVATSVNQRNYIAKSILNLKVNGKPEEIDKIAQMERNGLAVYHLSELSGIRYDYLLFSGTYGKKDHQDYSFLNTPDGIRQLSELMAVGSESIILINSIAEKTLEKWRSQTELTGYFMYANYLKMASVIAQGKGQMQELIVNRIQKQFPNKSNRPIDTSLYDEIGVRLAPYLPKIKIHQGFQVAHLELPLVLENQETRQLLSINVDGFFATHPVSDPEWELERRKTFLSHMIIPHFTWSVEWWKNPDKTAKLLSAEINQLWA